MNTRKAIALALSISMALGSTGTPLVGALAPVKKALASDRTDSKAAPTADPSRDITATMWNNDTSASITLPAQKGRTGWTAAGWLKSTAANPAGALSAESSTDISENTTFYGLYKQSATFKVNGKEETHDVYSNSSNPDEQQTTITAPSSDPTKPGYTFRGWKEEGGDGTLYPSGSSMTVTGKNEVVEAWEANTYNVEYWDGDEKKGNDSFVYDQDQSLKTSTDLNLAKTGYSFEGWAETDGGTVKWTDGQTVKNLTMENDKEVKIFAVWKANTYTVDYWSDGKSVGTAVNTYDKDSNLKSLKELGVSKPGYTLLGWATKANSTAKYSDGQTVKNLTSKANGSVKLYAVWDNNKYTIQYYDGDTSIGNTVCSYGIEKSLSGVSSLGVEKRGYTFSGWSTENGGSVVYSDGAKVKDLCSEVDGSVKLYTVWTPNNYVVEYWNGEQKMGESQFVYDQEATLKTITELGVEKSGSTFSGWSVNKDTLSDGQKVKNLAEKGTVKLQALWSVNKYKVEVHDGKNKLEDSKTGKTTVVLDSSEYDSSLAGYEVKGWSIKPNGSVSYKDGTTLDNTKLEELTKKYGQPLKFYVVKKPIVYKIKYIGSNAGNPTKYTVEDSLTLKNPAKKGYKFGGWTGTGLKRPTAKVTIKKGSIGNREYRATWVVKKKPVIKPTRKPTEAPAFDYSGGSSDPDYDSDIGSVYDNDSTNSSLTSGGSGNNADGSSSSADGSGSDSADGSGNSADAGNDADDLDPDSDDGAWGTATKWNTDVTSWSSDSNSLSNIDDSDDDSDSNDGGTDYSTGFYSGSGDVDVASGDNITSKTVVDSDNSLAGASSTNVNSTNANSTENSSNGMKGNPLPLVLTLLFLAACGIGGYVYWRKCH